MIVRFFCHLILTRIEEILEAHSKRPNPNSLMNKPSGYVEKNKQLPFKRTSVLNDIDVDVKDLAKEGRGVAIPPEVLVCSIIQFGMGRETIRLLTNNNST